MGRVLSLKFSRYNVTTAVLHLVASKKFGSIASATEVGVDGGWWGLLLLQLLLLTPPRRGLRSFLSGSSLVQVT